MSATRTSGVRIDQAGDAANILYGFEVESAVLGIDEYPVESGSFVDTRDLRGSELAPQ